jgi:glycosyltransferase involved in cell wall biosynthesis
VRLLFVGGDFIRKGGDLLLRWARETTKRAWELHCVTTEPQQNVPPNVVIHNGLRANTPELIALTQSCDLLVLPTRADCFSLAALEAMACGLPVLISRVGGIPDIVQDGETGHLVPPNDYDVLAHTLETLLDNPDRREAMGRRAREVVCARFAARHTLRQAVDIMLDSA